MVSAFAQTLRRYTSLNHLAQAARAVLQNTSQINQMLSDLNRVDFANVQVTPPTWRRLLPDASPTRGGHGNPLAELPPARKMQRPTKLSPQQTGHLTGAHICVAWEWLGLKPSAASPGPSGSTL